MFVDHLCQRSYIERKTHFRASFVKIKEKSFVSKVIKIPKGPRDNTKGKSAKKTDENVKTQDPEFFF